MKNNIDSDLKDLNSVGIESSLVVFRNCFSFLSYSFTNLTIGQLDNWVMQLGDSNLESMWARQKEMKFPSFILYFGIWHFRDKVLHEKSYSRNLLVKQKALSINCDRVKEITDKINRFIGESTVFEGVAFLGSLIGAWMLTCPKYEILRTISPPNSQPNEVWLKSVFSDTLGNGMSSDELELLYRLDYHLYLTFEDVEARNTF